MNVQSNTYTFIFASVMVLVVALALAFTATQLKPYYQENIKKEKQQNILASIGIDCSRDEAVKLYEKYIKKTYVINSKGEIISDDVSKVNLEIENKKNIADRNLPVFECEKDGKTFFIIPVRGKGLWGPLWGYIALQDDYQTIEGVTFDHKAETPGLGAEISTREFQKQFAGKKIFNETGEFISVEVVKGGADPSSLYQVDAISGGTITSKALESMIYDCLLPYENYFKSNR